MAINNVRVVILPAPLVREAVTAGPLWRLFGERIRTRSVALCPRNDSPGREPGPHLADSMQVRFVVGTDPRIEIFSSQTVKGGASKLALVLQGTPPHDIDPVDAQALVFTKGGQVVFAGHVNHPGTKKNDFVLAAMKQISREAGGTVL